MAKNLDFVSNKTFVITLQLTYINCQDEKITLRVKIKDNSSEHKYAFDWGRNLDKDASDDVYYSLKINNLNFLKNSVENSVFNAIKRLEKFLKYEFGIQKNNDFYFLKCDIRKYFQSINHEILLGLLKKINFSTDEMWLIEKLIKEQPNNAEIGLPLGNQSSQWFALFYLNEIDRLIKEKLRIKGYIRYMDDMILIHNDKKYLQKCLLEIRKACKEKLNLELNDKTQIGKVKNGIDFLGYRHILNSRGGIIRKLRVSSKQRMKKHLKIMKKLRIKNIIDDEYIYVRKNAFYNHLKNTSESYKLKKEVYPF